MEITTEMLHAAVKKAFELKIIPQNVSLEDYARYWDAIEKVLKAALEKV
jgi:hypothetical protein